MKGVGTRGDHHATTSPGILIISSAFDERVPTAGRWKASVARRTTITKLTHGRIAENNCHDNRCTELLIGAAELRRTLLGLVV